MMSPQRANPRPAPPPEWRDGNVRSPGGEPGGFAPAGAAIQSLDIQINALLDAAADGLVMVNEAGVIRAFNPAAERMFGYAAHEIVGADVGALAAEPRPAGAERNIADYLGARREVMARRKDGEPFPIDLAVSEFFVGGERIFLGTVRDISGRKQAEKEREERFVTELTRSNAELARFAYIASHDLQEPLRMIASYLDLLSARYSDQLDADAQDFIAFAVDGAARMKRLINDLLEYSRVGGDELKLAPVDCAELVAEVVASLSVAIAESGARIDSNGLPWVVADGGQLRRVFQNLIENALKYRSEAPPHIRVAAVRAGEGWRFDVTDNGIGIDPRFKTKVFEIFSRLQSRSRYPGSGIGLAVARLAVERHGGSIWVEPAEGGGSRFSFTLPESEA